MKRRGTGGKLKNAMVEKVFERNSCFALRFVVKPLAVGESIFNARIGQIQIVSVSDFLRWTGKINP